MNGYDFFRIHQPLNLHFTTSYDIFKYGGKSKSVSYTSYSSKKNKSIYDGWARAFPFKEGAGRMCIANFVYGGDGWLYQEKEGARQILATWEKIRQNMSRTILEESKQIVSIRTTKDMSWLDMVNPTPSGKKPPLLQLGQGGHISKEFLCVLDLNFNFLDVWHTIYVNDPFTSDWLFRLQKYRPFWRKTATDFQQQVEVVKN